MNWVYYFLRCTRLGASLWWFLVDFKILVILYYILLKKYPTLFLFAKKIWWISMKRAWMRRRWTFIGMREFFPRLSIASVDGKSTKHYLTQMLLAINWCYLHAGKNSRIRIRLKVASCKRVSLKSSKYSQKKVGYFSNRYVIRVYIHRERERERESERENIQ